MSNDISSAITTTRTAKTSPRPTTDNQNKGKKSNRPVAALHIPPSVWAEAKIEAIKRGWTLTKYVETALINEKNRN